MGKKSGNLSYAPRIYILHIYIYRETREKERETQFKALF